MVHDGLCEVCMQLKLHAQLTVTSLTAPRLFCNPWNSGLITAGQAKPFSANMVLALAQWSTACPLRAEATRASSDFRVAESIARCVASRLLGSGSFGLSRRVQRFHTCGASILISTTTACLGELKLPVEGLSGRASALSQTMMKKIWGKRWMIVRRRCVRKAKT